MSQASALAAYREKWREAPQGSDTDGRVFSSDLLALADGELLARWEAMAARRASGELGWLEPLYADTFRGRRILELGSGLGFDAMRFAARGARWTCADIVADNLALIRRVAALKGLAERIDTHLIGDDLTFTGLAPGYDVIWVFGSIHHVPFEIARREALSALALLAPKGRWMELVYPRERWLREGSLPFAEWGRLTDGERTPWAEWHDSEKVRQRLAPASFTPILDFGFCADNYRWIDLERVDAAPAVPAAATTLDLLRRHGFGSPAESDRWSAARTLGRWSARRAASSMRPRSTCVRTSMRSARRRRSPSTSRCW